MKEIPETCFRKFLVEFSEGRTWAYIILYWKTRKTLLGKMIRLRNTVARLISDDLFQLILISEARGDVCSLFVLELEQIIRYYKG